MLDNINEANLFFRIYLATFIYFYNNIMNGIFSTKKAKSVKIISLSLFFTALIYLSSNASSFSSHLEKVKFVLLIE